MSSPQPTATSSDPRPAPTGQPAQGSRQLDPPAQPRDETSAPLKAAKSPVSSALIAAVGIVLALGLTAVGVAAVRDALVYAGLVDGTPLLSSAARAVNGTTTSTWLVPVAVVLAVLGLWLLTLALKPRRSTTVALSASTGVVLRRKDVARVAQIAAEHVDGVEHASASSTKRAVTIRLTDTGDPNIAEQVQHAVTNKLTALENPPTVKVRRRKASS